MANENFTVESTSNAPDPEMNNQTVGAFLWDLARVVLIAFVVMVGFRYFIAEPFIVSGSSMVPNFQNKEYLVVNKVGNYFGEYERGDVIVFRYPKDNRQFFIKRIVALPGEKVKIEDGKVKIFNQQNPNGAFLQESYLPSQDMTFGQTDLVTLGTDEFYVMGDNRLASSDSRVWGILPRHDIIGEAWLRVFPLNSFGTLNFPNPTLD